MRSESRLQLTTAALDSGVRLGARANRVVVENVVRRCVQTTALPTASCRLPLLTGAPPRLHRGKHTTRFLNTQTANSRDYHCQQRPEIKHNKKKQTKRHNASVEEMVTISTHDSTLRAPRCLSRHLLIKMVQQPAAKAFLALVSKLRQLGDQDPPRKIRTQPSR